VAAILKSLVNLFSSGPDYEKRICQSDDFANQVEQLIKYTLFKTPEGEWKFIPGITIRPNRYDTCYVYLMEQIKKVKALRDEILLDPSTHVVKSTKVSSIELTIGRGEVPREESVQEERIDKVLDRLYQLQSVFDEGLRTLYKH
jgi:hypothetical protein